MSKFTERLRIQTREATLHRLCRVSTRYRPGGAIRVYEVREPTPENLAAVGALVRTAHRSWKQASSMVFVAEG